MGWSHGLLYAFDSLYVTVAEGNDQTPAGVYRLRDTNGDDQFDHVQQLFRLDSAGEHGPHNMVVGPDGKSLYLICGNGTPLVEGIQRRRPVATDGIDHLMPPGFESSEYTPAGWICRCNPDGSQRCLVASGLRNSFDLAFNRQGDLFTFDSDMEWDLGTPWYRPTRICHVISGAEFGWRGDAAKWPESYEDSVPPVLNVGPSSPTGVAFGYGTQFPTKYQNAFYVCDWTFATIHAVHLEQQGAGYRGKLEEFLGGRGLPITDIAVGRDGALYFIVGGRRLGSALYRVRYTGDERVIADQRAQVKTESFADTLPALRRQLEAYHGRQAPDAVRVVWPHLGHRDRLIRYAARVALEAQPIDTWREKALSKTDVAAKLTSLLALARQGTTDDLAEVIAQLNSIDLAAFDAGTVLRALRVYELALARGEDEALSLKPSINRKLRPLFPAENSLVDRELSRILCYLGEESMIGPLLELMREDAGERPVLATGYFVRNVKYGEAVRDMLQSAPLVNRMHHAQMLLWMDEVWTNEQRADYFALLADAQSRSQGGHWYEEFWERIAEVALDQIPEDRRERFAEVVARPLLVSDEENLPQPNGPGEAWTLAEVLEMVEHNFRERDFDNGKKMFAAARCVTCHRFKGEGSSVGPDLSSVGQRFTLRDILDAVINPHKAISDQYRLSLVVTDHGRTYTGRIVAQDSQEICIATDLMRPSQTITIAVDQIDELQPMPVSSMPPRLLNTLNDDEVLDLLAYLIAGGAEEHPVFGD